MNELYEVVLTYGEGLGVYRQWVRAPSPHEAVASVVGNPPGHWLPIGVRAELVDQEKACDGSVAPVACNQKGGM